MMYDIKAPWAIRNFTQIMDGMVIEYRNNKYKDERMMAKIYTKLENKPKLNALGLPERGKLTALESFKMDA